MITIDRRVIHFEVTRNPTQVWLAQQITEAFPWDTAPRYLLRDRDTSYGLRFQKRVRAMGIEEVLRAPRSPWQSPYVERIIGSIRRECLDHVIFFNETHLRLFSLISQEENASVVEQRLSGPPSHPTAFGWQDRRISGGRWHSLSLRTSRGLSHGNPSAAVASVRSGPSPPLQPRRT